MFIKQCKINSNKLPKSVTCIKSFNILDDVLYVKGECTAESCASDNVDVAVEILMQ